MWDVVDLNHQNGNFPSVYDEHILCVIIDHIPILSDISPKRENSNSYMSLGLDGITGFYLVI